MGKAITFGEVCRRIPDAKPYQIKYAIETYRIEPQSRAGVLRLWSEEDVARIAAAVKRCAERRGGRL